MNSSVPSVISVANHCFREPHSVGPVYRTKKPVLAIRCPDRCKSADSKQFSPILVRDFAICASKTLTELRSDDDVRALAVFMEAIEQAQALDRHGVRDWAVEQFETDRIVDSITTSLDIGRLAGGIAGGASVYSRS